MDIIKKEEQPKGYVSWDLKSLERKMNVSEDNDEI
jgi:hypothetical protein